MKLRHIYINKEGEPMGNPYQEYPKHSGDTLYRPAYQDEKLVEKYHSGLLPFEDKELANVYALLSDTGYKPDTLIPVDIEVEVVKQKIAAHENSDKSWGPVVLEGHKLFQYRKVLRIKN